MTDQELERFLDDLESDLSERKESPKDGDRIRETICAFANDLPDHRRPGVLFIGVRDNGAPVGLPITDDLLKNLASMRDDGNILPFPSIDVQKRVLKGQEVVVVLVLPSKSPPVRFKGRIWVRSGPRRAVASPDDERRLSEKRRFADLPADIRPISSADTSVLDELVFRRMYLSAAVAPDVLQQNERDLEHQYLAVRFAHPGPPICPTLLGVLAVGRLPTEWIPGAYVQFLRIAGRELADPIRSEREIRGPLPTLLSSLDEVLRVNIQSSVDIASSDTEIRKPDYPLAALQQIVRNAVLHRSYESTNAPVRIFWFEDRIEILSPGGPFGQVTRQNFGQPGASDYRNPNIATVMKELGYVQRFGVGIATARRELEENGNPELVFQVEDAHVAAIIRKAP